MKSKAYSVKGEGKKDTLVLNLRPGSNEDKQLTPTMTVMVKEKVGSFQEKVNC